MRAEVIGWQELVDAGGYAGAREHGTLRLEGRDYVDARRRRDHRQVHPVAPASLRIRAASFPRPSASAAPAPAARSSGLSAGTSTAG